MELTVEEKKYWYNIVTPEAVESILKRRYDNDQLSCAYDIAKAFNPEGTVPEYVKNRVSQLIWNLYANGQIKKIRKDRTSNPDNNQKKWHYKYSPTPRSDWLSLVQNRHKRKSSVKRTRLFSVSDLAYFEEIMAYAKKHGTFTFRQAFRDITGLEKSTPKAKNKEAYIAYQRLYNAMKYLHRHGYFEKIIGTRFISFRLVKEPVQEKTLEKVFTVQKPRAKPMEITPMKKVSVEVEVLNSNISDKTKIALLKKLMGEG